MNQVVWSINIMIAILLLAVGYVIYWVFKYDDWNPNPIVTSNITDEHRSDDPGFEGSPVRAE